MKVNMKGLTNTIGKVVKSKTFKDFIIVETGMLCVSFHAFKIGREIGRMDLAEDILDPKKETADVLTNKRTKKKYPILDNGFVWDEETSSAKFFKYHPQAWRMKQN